MLSQFSYPIICSEKCTKTVNFYEDYFDFTPEYETDDFIVLKRRNYTDSYLAVISINHESLPKGYRSTASGIILNYPVENVDAFYQQAYWEGLDIVNDPEIAACNRKHFFIKDPNEILIDVTQDVKKPKNKEVQKLKQLCTQSA